MNANNEIEKLKADGWIEYTPTLKFVVTDENNHVINTPKYVYLYKTDGKIASCKAIQVSEGETATAWTLPIDSEPQE